MKAVLVNIMLLIMLTIGGCGTSSNVVSAEDQQKLDKILHIAKLKSFHFEADAAFPLESAAVSNVTNVLLQNTGSNARRIILTGNGDFIKVEKDSARAVLAYFGEARVVASLDPKDNDITFENQLLNYDVSKNDKKSFVNVNFDVRGKRELYTVNIRMYPSYSATTTINSANRTTIKYDGFIKSLNKD